jgi:hypothetical protein
VTSGRQFSTNPKRARQSSKGGTRPSEHVIEGRSTGVAIENETPPSWTTAGESPHLLLERRTVVAAGSTTTHHIPPDRIELRTRRTCRRADKQDDSELASAVDAPKLHGLLERQQRI